MAYIDIISMLGYTNNAHMMMEAFESSSNIILSDNPNFTQTDFSSVFPVFKIADTEVTDGGEIPQSVFNLFKAMSDKAIKYKRYNEQWKYIMCLFIAHYLTLYLRTQEGDPSAQNALKGSLPIGLASSKSVDGLSISNDFVWANDSDFAGYGTWKQTIYGQQLITLTSMYGHAGMWVNG